MLKLQPPITEFGQFHNFRCGEVLCIGPSTYHVCCSLCGQKILYQFFPQHFRLEHLSQAEECKLFNKDGKIAKKGEDVDIFVKAEDDPIGHKEADSENVTVDLAQIALFDYEEEEANDEETMPNEKKIISKETNPNAIPPAAIEKLSSRNNDLTQILSVRTKTKRIEVETEKLIATRRSSRKRQVCQNEPKDMVNTLNYKETLVPKTLETSTSSIVGMQALTTNVKDIHEGSEADEPVSTDWQDNINYVSDGNNDDDDDDDEQQTDPNLEMLFPCDQCERLYNSKRGLQYHKRAKHTIVKSSAKKTTMPIEELSTISSCSDSLTTSTATKLVLLKKSKQTRNNIAQEFKCDDCDMVFRRERELRGHRWKHTGINCDICGKPFTQTGNMMRHRVRHSGIKAFKCTECDASFYTNKELNSHKICHTGRMPVICEICGRPCRDRGVLTAHMRRHTGERPAKCDVCGKSFYSFHDLNVHAVAHTSARPFVCDICGSTFQRKKALRVHKLLHSDQRKYVCKICGKAFAQSGGLNAHLRIHDAAAIKAAAADEGVEHGGNLVDQINSRLQANTSNGAGTEHLDVAVDVGTGEVTISMTVEAIQEVPWESTE